MDEPVRLGVIGAGSMAMFSIFPALYLAPFQLIAVCDLEEERARQAAQKFGAQRWYSDYRRMLSAEELEAVIVHMHAAPRFPVVRAALEAGRHVFIPKPPAVSLEQTQELAELAERYGRILMVNFQRRFSLAVRQALELMSEPDFGQLTQVFGSFCSGRFDGARVGPYRDHLEAYLLDFSIHHLDLARYLGGEVQSLAIYHRELEGALSLAAALQFSSGAVGALQLNSQRIWWRNYDRVELTGQGAYLVLEGLWSIRKYTGAENTFTENYTDQRSAELTGDGLSLIEFAASLREGREPISSIRDAVATMRLFQRIYEAVRAGRNGVIALDR